MHVVLHHPASGGQLWLGGIEASRSTEILLANGIRFLLSATRSPLPVVDSRLEHLPTLDAASLMAGEIDMLTLVAAFGRVKAALQNGRKILFCCKTGRKSSPLIAALFLMYSCKESAASAREYLMSVRSVVTLTGRLKSTRFRELREVMHFLEAQETELLGRNVGVPMVLNQVVPPSLFKQKALQEIGFQVPQFANEARVAQNPCYSRSRGFFNETTPITVRFCDPCLAFFS